MIASPHCRFELDAFLAREADLGRDDLVFPILYIDVPALQDDARRQKDPVLSLIAKRQYVDWRKLRHRDMRTTDVSEAIERFCTDIRNALDRPWISPEERVAQEEAVARRQGEAERQRQEGETKRRAEVERHRAAELEAEARADAEQRQREAEAQQQKAEAERQKAEQQRLREEAEAQRRAQAEEQRRLRRAQARPLWPPSRPALVAASLLAAAGVGLGLWLFAMPPRPSTLSMSPGPVALSVLSPDQERALRPKDMFKECAICPQMIVVPAGSFTLGSPASEPGRHSDEGPQRIVPIARQYAVGQFELTFDEWDACVAEGGCNGYRPSDYGWGRGHRPVIYVSWDDAKAYVAWLAKKTDKFWYRLLTEAEYEYAARAGTTTAYPWGSAIGKNNANCDGCGSQSDNKQTVPVGSFTANAFGFYDMVGNVWAWTEDCYHDSYNGAPTDGSAWTSGNCDRHVLRGGSWFNSPESLRSAGRYPSATNTRTSAVGFRVGRTLLTP